MKRFEAYGWHTQTIPDGDTDLQGIHKAIEAAKKVTDKPSIIKLRTTIGKTIDLDLNFYSCVLNHANTTIRLWLPSSR